jgi:hypothetical protein
MHDFDMVLLPCILLIMSSTAAAFNLCPLIYLVMLGDLDSEWMCSSMIFLIVPASINHFCTDMSVIYIDRRVKST